MTMVLTGGVLIDGSGRDPVRRGGVVIEGERIVQAGPIERLSFGKEAHVVDVDGRTIMPGLIDCHTHLTYHTSEPDVWQQDFGESVELNTLYAARNAEFILETGVTSIGDGGCRGYIGPAIRDGVRRGLIPGPRVMAAGPILSGPAGLFDFAPPWVRLESDAALSTIVSGPEEVRRTVSKQIKGGVDWIKVAASGVAGSRYSTAETQDLSYEEMRAAVVEAAKYGKPVHAHAHSREGVRAAIEAGVISLHSGEFADEETLGLMRQKGIVFSPTIAWLQARYLPVAKAPENEAFREQAWQAYAAAKDALVAARRMGVEVAIGSDASHRFQHAPDAVLEMEYYVALGFSPLEVITSATRISAKAINRSSDLGTLEAGKLADILVVSGDPATDISVLRDKRNLWKLYLGGKPIELSPSRGVIGGHFRPKEWINITLDDVRRSKDQRR